MSQMGFDFTSSQAAKSAAKKESDEPRIITVSDLNRMIRGSLEKQFHTLWLQAEVSNFKAHTSGHWYFSLKDEKAQVSGVMFRGHNSRIKFRPENGMEVIVRGKITVYEPRGNYQVFCETMEPVGAGALQQAFEQLKAKLAKEGLFDKTKKKPIPKLPKHVAVVTSPTGAAIQDILNVLARRFRGLQVTIVPARVQGDVAAKEILRGIQLADRLNGVDTIIVGRGGGSIEDLWCFNDEKVARAIAACKTPVISAVGHEIDFTISDFVADLRAPTPSAAAELVTANVLQLYERIESLEAKLVSTIERKISDLWQSVDHLRRRLVDPKTRLADLTRRCGELQARVKLAIERRLQYFRQAIELHKAGLVSPQILLNQSKQRLESNNHRLKRSILQQLAQSQQKLHAQGLLLDSLSPLKVVDRGYSIVKVEGKVVKSIKKLKEKDIIDIQFAEGSATAEIQTLEN